MTRRHPIRRGSRTSLRRKKRKANMRQCDAVFSKLVRSHGYCQGQHYISPFDGRAIECKGPLQCAHIMSRVYRATRWSWDNALCLCAAHHLWWTHHPLEWHEFVEDKIGEQAYEALRRRARQVTQVDYAEVLRSMEGA